uniref:SUN domain-containing protein n=1 Tax=Macrostomum lignano TaxID=282301 RepID=A0A1I8IFB9_9PLAT
MQRHQHQQAESPSLNRTFALICCATAACLVAVCAAAAVASGVLPSFRVELSTCSLEETTSSSLKDRLSIQQQLQNVRRDLTKGLSSCAAEASAGSGETGAQLESVRFALIELRHRLDRLSSDVAELTVAMRRQQSVATPEVKPKEKPAPIRPLPESNAAVTQSKIAATEKPEVAKTKPEVSKDKLEVAKVKPEVVKTKPEAGKAKPEVKTADASASKAPPAPQRIQPNAGGGATPPIRVMSQADMRQAELDKQPMVRAGSGELLGRQVLHGIKPKKIFQDGRRIPPVKLERIIPAPGSSVQVYMFDELLSDVESDSLAAVHFKRLEALSSRKPIVCFDSEATMQRLVADEAGVVRRGLSSADFTAGTRCLNASLSAKASSWLRFNWTRSTVFYPGESRFTAGPLADRFLKSMGLPASHAGRLDVTSHPLGQGFSEQLDCKAKNGASGAIFATVRVFLDTVTRGGEFHLPKLGIWLRPRKSRALLVTQLAPDTGACEPAAAYNSSWVQTGRSITLTQRFHYAAFPGIGQRPSEPALPVRPADTPAVMCDSTAPPCRWSDEWTDEHLI